MELSATHSVWLPVLSLFVCRENIFVVNQIWWVLFCGNWSITSKFSNLFNPFIFKLYTSLILYIVFFSSLFWSESPVVLLISLNKQLLALLILWILCLFLFILFFYFYYLSPNLKIFIPHSFSNSSSSVSYTHLRAHET